MNMKLAYSDLDAINREVPEYLMAALRKTTKRGKPFLVEWRQAEAKTSCWQDDSGAGCGCGPVE
jgi:hypothetical protein